MNSTVITEEERALNGLLFDPGAPELVAKKAKAHRLSQMFNNLFEEQQEERCVILRELLGELGDRSLFHGPLRFHYGCHTRIGRNCFFNFNLTIQDDSAVTIGNDCNFGPNVTIVTPVHPMLANERRLLKCSDGVERHLCFAKPVTIGDDCWVGANVVICPGVTIGNGCVVGAGSVVTRDVPPDSFAAGNPARVIREITEKDSVYLKFDEIY